MSDPTSPTVPFIVGAASVRGGSAEGPNVVGDLGSIKGDLTSVKGDHVSVNGDVLTVNGDALGDGLSQVGSGSQFGDEPRPDTEETEEEKQIRLGVNLKQPKIYSNPEDMKQRYDESSNIFQVRNFLASNSTKVAEILQELYGTLDVQKRKDRIASIDVEVDTLQEAIQKLQEEKSAISDNLLGQDEHDIQLAEYEEAMRKMAKSSQKLLKSIKLKQARVQSMRLDEYSKYRQVMEKLMGKPEAVQLAELRLSEAVMELEKAEKEKGEKEEIQKLATEESMKASEDWDTSREATKKAQKEFDEAVKHQEACAKRSQQLCDHVVKKEREVTEMQMKLDEIQTKVEWLKKDRLQAEQAAKQAIKDRLIREGLDPELAAEEAEKGIPGVPDTEVGLSETNQVVSTEGIEGNLTGAAIEGNPTGTTIEGNPTGAAIEGSLTGAAVEGVPAAEGVSATSATGATSAVNGASTTECMPGVAPSSSNAK